MKFLIVMAMSSSSTYLYVQGTVVSSLLEHRNYTRQDSLYVYEINDDLKAEIRISLDLGFMGQILRISRIEI
ncbi:hypothetical protein OIU79_015783, partial [Salix purpurea]